MKLLRSVLAVASAAMALSPSAFANGRFPTANQLCVRPGDPSHLTLRSTFGLLVSSDTGQHWDWICEDAFGLSIAYDPPIALFGDGTLMVGMYDGLRLSSDSGCGFRAADAPVGLSGVADVVVRPDHPDVGYVLTSKAESAEAGLLPTYRNLVFVTTDDGSTFSQVGAPLDSDVFVETIEVGASDPNRLYVSGSVTEATTTSGVVLVSSDGGQTWTRWPVPLLATEQAPFIAAVAPDNADRVYVRTLDPMSGLGRLLVTDDGGRTFREVYRGGALTGFALSPDGTTLFVGGTDQGLLTASSTSLVFSNVAPNDIECLTTSGSSLYACTSQAEGALLLVSKSGGGTFDPMLSLETIRGPLGCPAGTAVAVCGEEWAGFQNTYGSPAQALPADAGGDAAPEAGSHLPQPAAPGTTGASCSLRSGASAPPRPLVELLVALLAAATVGRRKRATCAMPRQP